MKASLKRLKIPVGPWLKRFKEALYEEHEPENQFRVVWTEAEKEHRRTFRLGDLANQIASISPGQKITYIVDVLFSPENCERIIDFARNADQLFIEAAFLETEQEIARNKYHLTAKQAGTLARKSGAKQYTLFHFSPRYTQAAHMFQEEADRAFMETPGNPDS
jgi:ribonuclease Z